METPVLLQRATAQSASCSADSQLAGRIRPFWRTHRRRGILCSAVIWFGFIATRRAKAYIFEVRTFQIFAIYTGYYLIDLILMDAIVGAWKKKPESVARKFRED